MPVYVVRPAILFGPSDPSAFVKGFVSKSRWDGLLAKEEIQLRDGYGAKFKIHGMLKLLAGLVLFCKLIN